MLPRICPYFIPTGFDLHRARVGWKPDPARAVLLVHDMQNYFLAPFGIADQALAARVVRNIGMLRECGIPVVYTAQPGGQTPAERGLQQDFWGDGPPDDPRALAIVDALTPAAGDLRLTKRRDSAFAGTVLADLLGDRDQLIITGVYAHAGVLATAQDAFMRDIQAFVVADAVADFSPAHHREALRRVSDRCGVVGTAAEIAELL
ncbi:isochorismatase family protein [Micromonospora craniellae]|uniref:isochorismatase family protein n=1 Tax=Micromonospora craniellae TaxID=2294034 RepID=UPI001CC7D356|nr:isochorismatase family protein [Micromonospora craniellae]